jgi:hypothetical protein
MKESSNKSCSNCLIKKKGECSTGFEVCEFYKPAPSRNEDKINNWPNEMKGAYGTLHSNRKN